ncbi:MAG TPA: POTRA domain-containing protein, partial [Candidatus Berkiella sp.]|nr:POTRA domain-containing protein [Candidatus Berkiella sp.]
MKKIIEAQGFEQFVVKDIRIEGLQRITEGTVYNYLPVNVGESLAPEKTGEILRALFETGFFQDIELKRDGNVLVVQVIERPTIGKITVSGNKEITEENLLTTLKTAGLAEGYVFDRAMLEQVRNELERLYFSHGKYAVKV